jgi:glycosyltransferase involved in cell wall biosynthesis
VSLRIVIDARLNAYREGGIPRYTRHLLAALTAHAPDATFISLQHRRQTAPLVIAPNVRRHRAWTPPHHRHEWLALPLELAPVVADVAHFPDTVAPQWSTMPRVVTIHDLAFLRFPEILDDDARAFYGRVAASARAAAAVIAVSHATRRDIIELLGIPAERIVVIHEAPALAHAAPSATVAQHTRQIAGVTVQADRFALFVSTLEPRKNLTTLLTALHRCRQRHPGVRIPLVVAGARGWQEAAIFARVAELQLEDQVLFCGAVDDATLHWLYQHCRIYCNPSRYEGFGLPLLEALRAGAACLASDTSSLPEIGGAAARYVPPLDSAAWADALADLWHDAAARDALRVAGPRRAAQFSWERAARATFAVYRRAAGGMPPRDDGSGSATADHDPPPSSVAAGSDHTAEG